MALPAASPQPGDFGLATAAPWYADRLIRAGEWLNGDGFSQYSHAFVVVDGGMVVEAEPGGARLTPLADYTQHGVGGSLAFSSWELTDEQRHHLCVVARSLVGIGYSWADYFAIAAHRLHVPAPGLKAYIESCGHMICSQLTDYIYSTQDLHMFSDGRWPGFVTPADLSHVLDGPLTERHGR